MSRHDDRTRIRHMLDHAVEVVEMARERSREDIDNNRQLNLSLVRLLEIIGEAASKVTVETQAANPDVKWNQIISLRNRLIHGYDEVDFDILWDIIQYDLPSLITELKRLLAVK